MGEINPCPPYCSPDTSGKVGDDVADIVEDHEPRITAIVAECDHVSCTRVSREGEREGHRRHPRLLDETETRVLDEITMTSEGVADK